MSDNVHVDVFDRYTRLRELRNAHRALDTAIDELSQVPVIDQVRVRRLKKERLRLKDLITRLESALIPDLNA